MPRIATPARTFLPALSLLFLTPLPAAAVITKLTPLKEVLATEDYIFVAAVEKVDPARPAMVLTLAENLKGKLPFEKLPVNLTGDAEAKKDKHTEVLLKRVAEKQQLVFFASARNKRYTAFGYANGTWFQMAGTAGDDGAVRWGFLHCEPYLRRTFKGTTDELKQVLADALAEKKAPPEPDLKEPPGFGPEVEKQKDKETRDTRHETPKAAGLRTGGVGLFAVIPTFVLVGPLAVLAALFPAVFGGLALLMKRWMVLLSVACTLSTLFFLQAWFGGRLQGTWWGTPQALYVTCAVLGAAGAVWSAGRYRKALRDGRADTWRMRKFDRWALAVFTLAGAVTLGVVAARGGAVLASPWLDVTMLTAAVGACAAFVLLWRPDPAAALPAGVSPETVLLWGLAFTCSTAGALEAGRGGASGFTAGSGTVAADDPLVPKLTGFAWERKFFEPADRGMFLATPAVTPERVFIAGMHSRGFKTYGIVYAVDPATGAEMWQFDNDGELKQVFCSPTVADGRVYVGEGLHEDGGCKLYCLEEATGKKLWDFPTASHTESTPCVSGGRVFFGAGDDGLYCLDAKTGEKLWQYPGGHVDSNPVVANGRVYAGSGLGGKKGRKVIFCVDAATGKELWVRPTEYSAYGTPTVAGKYLYCGTGNGNFSMDKEPVAGLVLCLNAESGEPVWERPLPNSVVAKPAADRNTVYAGCRDGNCYALDRKTGEVRWSRSVGSPVVAAPAVKLSPDTGSAQAVYVAGQKGKVASLSPVTGEPFWELDVAKQSQLPEVTLDSSPVVAVSRDGLVERRRVYFGAGLTGTLAVGASPRLYCLQEEVNLGGDEE